MTCSFLGGGDVMETHEGAWEWVRERVSWCHWSGGKFYTSAWCHIYILPWHLCLPSCKARSLTSWNSYRILIEEASRGMLLTTGSSLHTIISILGAFLSPFSRSVPLLWLASELLVFFRGYLQKNQASHVSNFLGFVLDITAGPSGFF